MSKNVNKDFNKDLLNLNYVESKEDSRIMILDKNYDLADISRITKISINKLKKDYNRGLVLLNNLVEAFNLFNDHSQEDLESYIQDQHLEEIWKKQFPNYKYIPYMGIEEFAILHKYNYNLLTSLKN